MLFVAVQAIVVESWVWIGSSSRQQEDTAFSYWLPLRVSQLLVPTQLSRTTGGEVEVKFESTLFGRSKLSGCAWRSLRDWIETERRRTANMKLCRVFLGSYLSFTFNFLQEKLLTLVFRHLRHTEWHGRATVCVVLCFCIITPRVYEQVALNWQIKLHRSYCFWYFKSSAHSV